MISRQVWDKGSRFIWYCQRGGAILSAWIIAFLVALLSVDVVARYVFNSPLPVVYQFTQAVLMPCIVYFAVAAADHVAVKVVTGRVRGKAGQMLQLFSLIVTIGFVGLVTWQCWVKAMYSIFISEAMMEMIGIPIYPVRVITALGIFMLLLVLIVRLVSNVTKVGSISKWSS